MDPTAEQQQAIDLFKTGESLAIEAGAGTGKTSTLVMLAREGGPSKVGQYVAFNRALVDESRPKFPLTVNCNTAHSLAFRVVGKKYAHRLNSAMRMRSRDMAVRLGITEGIQALSFDGKERYLAPGFIASQAAQTVTKFCQSDDLMISRKHVPFVHGLDNMSFFALSETVVPLAKRMWDDLQNEYGWVPYKHEHYLKAWQLADPVINADFILFDESQDANPVIAAIVAAQARRSQLVYVGDSQQEIYGWTGAVNALARVEVAHRTYLTQSFRFGQAIADKANEVLDTLEAALRLTGNPAIASRIELVDSPRAILCRTNATGVTHLLSLQAAGRSAHFIGGSKEVLAFAEGAAELQTTGHSAHPDLLLFDSWAAVQAYVSDEEESGEDLRLMVKLVDTFGSAEIINGIQRMPTEARAEVVISTAHRSKGREWQSVQLTNDFPARADSDPADLRLLYVALTRAKEVLDLSHTKDAVLTEEILAE